ncbi:phosphatidate cytidylyltransferase [Kribbella sandramycini]|uniref:Phosphatidate cytidylyltransferase n=1 Tax=Kribbella sandramycini TaxID=60450 RepID=A0A7Y4L595_9ACTN|nr:phosphatidate cytidylyltransferase [Kribbella sandramycini]MBB6570546.1 phosphatidate cytidylyltransferase [Kribbella sandramycini]NOL43692.1 phosphatidate cytidylyltransferase [Kribbella sandramycini]
MGVESTPAPSTGPKPSRAGRNLPAAVGVGVGLGALIIGSLYWQKVLFTFLVLAAVLLAVDEMIKALRTGGAVIPRVPLFVGTTAMLLAAYFGGPMALLVALAVTVLGTIFWRMPGGSVGFVRDVTAGVFLIGYVPLLAGFAILLVQPDGDGPGRVLTFFLVVVASDVGGYAAGVLFGKHPMAPTISPKKSWEGFAGSTLACIGAGIASVVFLLDGNWWVGAIVGAVAVVTATVGDLGESMIKRDLGIKDMSNLLPGHGGVMDRLDSLLATAPAMWLLLHLLVKG